MKSANPEGASQHHGSHEDLEHLEHLAIHGHLGVRDMNIRLEYMAACTVNAPALIGQLGAVEGNAPRGCSG